MINKAGEEKNKQTNKKILLHKLVLKWYKKFPNICYFLSVILDSFSNKLNHFENHWFNVQRCIVYTKSISYFFNVKS